MCLRDVVCTPRLTVFWWRRVLVRALSALWYETFTCVVPRSLYFCSSFYLSGWPGSRSVIVAPKSGRRVRAERYRTPPLPHPLTSPPHQKPLTREAGSVPRCPGRASPPAALYYPSPLYHPPMSRYNEFQAFRSRLNARILGTQGSGGTAGSSEGGEAAARPGGTLVTKRFFALDDQAYRDAAGDGGLDKKTKELLGLAASMVLRCDDCIAYHVDQCIEAGCSERELWETFDISLIVGGSIVIPHLRRAVEFMDECFDRAK